MDDPAQAFYLSNGEGGGAESDHWTTGPVIFCHSFTPPPFPLSEGP